jgi:CheY-like chemotaxis protein
MPDSVLVVDDEFLIVEVLSMMLADMGLEVCGSAATADEAVALAELHAPRLVLMDVRLKGHRDGIEAAHAIRGIHPPTPIIFITGSREPATVDRIERDHAAAPVLFKPIRFDQLQTAVRKVLAH